MAAGVGNAGGAAGTDDGNHRLLRLTALGQALIAHDLRAHPYPGFAVLKERLQHAEVVFSDLETTLGSDSDGVPTRGGVFFHSAPLEVLDCLRDLSVNVLALSNNHSFDLGARGLENTIDQVRRRGFGYAGTGANVHTAAAPGYLQLAWGRIALVACASKVPDGSVAAENHAGVNHLALGADGAPDATDRRRILDAIERAACEARFVLAYHHDHYWAPDWHETPTWKQAFARDCIDAGANAYVSHGVPLLHGIAIHRGRPIFYGLGSFIFHTRTKIGHYEPAVWESVAAYCAFRDGALASLRLDPIALNEFGEDGPDFLPTRGRPTLASGAQARSILERVRMLSAPYGATFEIRSDCGELYAELKGR